MADSFINYSDNSNTKNLAFNRLLELIRIYSTRNRFKDGKLNVYGGDKIIYDFQSIEKILFNEFIFGRKLLINSQRVFIFSNEVFANERNDLINQIIKKFKINNDEIIISEMELKKDIDEMDDEKKIKGLYYDFQNILIYIYYFYIKDKNKEINEKITLKEICEKLEEYGYNRFYNKLKSSEITINNFIYLYECLEEKIFYFFKEILSKDIKLENLQNEKNNELNEYFETNKNLLLTKDIISSAFIKYIMRYCFCNYEKDEEILKNLNSNIIFNKEDIWGNKIFTNPKFKEEMNKLIDFNTTSSDNLEKYFLKLICYIEDEKEEEDEDEDKDEDDKSYCSKKSKDSAESSDKSESEKGRDSDDDDDE